MRFRPLHFDKYQEHLEKKTFTKTVSSIFTGIFTKSKPKAKDNQNNTLNPNKSAIFNRSANSSVSDLKENMSAININASMSKNTSAAGFS